MPRVGERLMEGTDREEQLTIVRCGVCDLEFISSDDLRVHMKIAHGRKQ